MMTYIKWVKKMLQWQGKAQSHWKVGTDEHLSFWWIGQRTLWLEFASDILVKGRIMLEEKTVKGNTKGPTCKAIATTKTPGTTYLYRHNDHTDDQHAITTLIDGCVEGYKSTGHVNVMCWSLLSNRDSY